MFLSEFQEKQLSLFLKQKVGMLSSIPREIADLSADFQLTIQKNEIKYFVLEQINQKKKKQKNLHTKQKQINLPRSIYGNCCLVKALEKQKSCFTLNPIHCPMKRTKNSRYSQSLVRPRMKHLFSFSDFVIIFNKIFNLYQF